jgi:hypothetical protein
MASVHDEQTHVTERRRHPRHPLGAPVKVRILVEEETFTPLIFEGVCENISRSGALVTVHGMSGKSYRKLIRRPRFVRVMNLPPGEPKSLSLFGKLIWYDYQDDQEKSVCKLAIAFEPMEEPAGSALEQYLETLRGPTV